MDPSQRGDEPEVTSSNEWFRFGGWAGYRQGPVERGIGHVGKVRGGLKIGGWGILVRGLSDGGGGGDTFRLSYQRGNETEVTLSNVWSRFEDGRVIDRGPLATWTE